MPELDPPSRILMGPGPSNVPARVYRALMMPTVGHMDPTYFKTMDQTQALLRDTFVTQNPLTIAISGTGMSGMETALVNLLESGDEIIVCNGGVFSGRMPEIARRCGATVRELKIQWGRATRPDEIAAALKEKPAKIVALVHGETSTGVLQTNLPDIAKICHAAGAILLVDTVASLGGTDFQTDAWDLDVVYSGSQKCLGVPPGIAPITLGKRAEEILAKRKSKVNSWYLDLTLIRDYWNEKRVYHHTGPVNMTYALHEGLRLIQEEGLANRVARHAKMAKALHAGVEAMGLKLFVQNPAERCPTLTTVLVPEGADDVAVRKTLLEQHNLEIGGGLGDLKGKAWRVGLMGEGARPNHVLLFLSAVGGILKKQGVKVSAGAGVEAAAAVINS
ncbi:MAG TPA: alanine--glyoxylate aminotransferase family protein [Planctomycetota bacterium]|nr:alanine--glyoxylate aminotransferase family protein [Planctomycetota bacterium]